MEVFPLSPVLIILMRITNEGEFIRYDNVSEEFGLKLCDRNSILFEDEIE